MKQLLIIFITCLGFSTMAIAEDFTIQVPVELHKIPADYNRLQVKCWLICRSLDEADAPRTPGGPSLTDLGNAISQQLYDQWTAPSDDRHPVLGYPRQIDVLSEEIQIVGMGQEIQLSI